MMPNLCKEKGSISVFLVLLLTIMSGFIITLAYSVKGYAAECEAVCAADTAVRSCFAEYNRKLFERYHILLIDSSYKGAKNGEERVLEHFSAYLEGSVSGNDLTHARIEECRDAAENDGEYMYVQAVNYEKSRTDGRADMLCEDDGQYFLRYLAGVLGNNMRVCEGAVREGEIEYLIYGYDTDEQNITLALSDYEDNTDISYEEYLYRRLEEEDILSVRRRFLELVKEYMRENESPGFDPGKCYHRLTFTAQLENGMGEYNVTRTYGYGSEEIW